MTPGSAPRLKIAIQKSGRLTNNSLDMIARCGLRFSRARDQLACYGENLPLDILLVRDDDIPGPTFESEAPIETSTCVTAWLLAITKNASAKARQ